MKSAKMEHRRVPSTVGGWVAATRPYPPLDEDISDDGGIDMEEESVRLWSINHFLD